MKRWTPLLMAAALFALIGAPWPAAADTGRSEPMHRVVVKPEVAKLRAGDAGSRNVAVTDKDGARHTLTFNRTPVFLAELPPEVATDKYLVVTEVSEEQMKAENGRPYDWLALGGEELRQAVKDLGSPPPLDGDLEGSDSNMVGEPDEELDFGDEQPALAARAVPGPDVDPTSTAEPGQPATGDDVEVAAVVPDPDPAPARPAAPPRGTTERKGKRR